MFLVSGTVHHPPRQAPVFPLKLAAGSRFLIDQLGRPFPILADTGYAAIGTLSTTDATSYFQDRAARGFTAVWLGAIDNQFNYGNTVSASTWGPNVNGDLPFTLDVTGASYTNAQTQKPRFDTPKSAYWSHCDDILNAAASAGLLVLFYPEWIGNPIGDPAQEGYYNALTDAANTQTIRQGFGQYLANRYGPSGSNPRTNLIIVPGGDNDPLHGMGSALPVTDVVTGWTSVDTSHLFSVDCIDGQSPIDAYSSPSWLQVSNVYQDQLVLGGTNYVYVKCKSEYQRADWKPMYFKEGAFEGEHSSANSFLRSQTWQAMLGGCCGYTFGNNPIWLFGSGWQTALKSRGSLDCQAANTFFGGRRWDLLVPDWSNAFLTNGGSYTNANFASAALAVDGSWGAIYVPNSESLTVAMSSFAQAVHGYWLDPTTAAVTDLGSFAPTGSQNFSRAVSNAQGDTDWVLFFEVPGRNVWV